MNVCGCVCVFDAKLSPFCLSLFPSAFSPYVSNSALHRVKRQKNLSMHCLCRSTSLLSLDLDLPAAPDPAASFELDSYDS